MRRDRGYGILGHKSIQDLEEWRIIHNLDDVIGYACNSRKCEIAQWLEDMGYKHADVGITTYAYYDKKGVYHSHDIPDVFIAEISKFDMCVSKTHKTEGWNRNGYAITLQQYYDFLENITPK